MCEEQWYVDRVRLRNLMQERPELTQQECAEHIGRSLGWVKKWAKRIRASCSNDDNVLRSRSHARHNPPGEITAAVVERILEIRDDPPENLKRVPGPKAILYYLAKDEALKQLGAEIFAKVVDRPTSGSDLMV